MFDEWFSAETACKTDICKSIDTKISPTGINCKITLFKKNVTVYISTFHIRLNTCPDSGVKMVSQNGAGHFLLHQSIL